MNKFRGEEMNTIVDEPEVELVAVRAMRASDLDAVVRIDAAASGRPRPRYFELMIDRAVKSASLQISLVAEYEGRVAGFLIASLYYGEFGMTEPTAAIEGIGVDPALRRQHVARSMFAQLRRNVGAIGATSIRTEVEWTDFDLLAFLFSEGFGPSTRLCLERRVDPTEAT
ncbi:MAG: GNAT family N-acetyltransferase [Thermoanaerobaculia bacterium]